ncbi:MAG: radical SAM protein [Magnetococcales bacterium]|nr:radical SAM protein [Magnetococcales bacterium]MBF0157035.1 radical SAM protein [Magnetococcales bacterium]
MSGSKLAWHQDRVADWLEGKRIAPLHIDVGLSKGCNIKCEYCFGGLQRNIFRRGEGTFFPRDPLLAYLRDAGQAGVRSMAFIGEAEPLINPHVYEAIVAGANAGIDIAMGTNGLLLDTGTDGEKALEHLTWLRFNISAASEESYQRIHASRDFRIALAKIRFAVESKHRRNLPVTIGLQMVLTPNNAAQALPLARLGGELGVDYLVIKQCSDTVENQLGFFDRLGEYEAFSDQLREAEACSRPDYNVIVKWHNIGNLGQRDYDSCLGAPFLLYSSGDGKLYPCGIFFDKQEDEYRMGDLTVDSFAAILASERYWEVVEKVKRVDVHSACYSNCRTHAINHYLWQVAHPPEHVNFI